MLAADKLSLQSHLKQQAVTLKEKEFNLHHENCMTVGTQAAVLAGLDITMLIEFQPLPITSWQVQHQVTARCLQLVYYTIITAAFGCNMRVVAQTTVLSVLGAGLALRGPDGSMMVATDCLYEERNKVFVTFATGMTLTVASLMVAVWLVLQWEAALACWMVAGITLHAIYANFHRVRVKLDFDENDTVDFRDLMESGPVLAPEFWKRKNWSRKQSRNDKDLKHHHHRHQLRERKSSRIYTANHSRDNNNNNNNSNSNESESSFDDMSDNGTGEEAEMTRFYRNDQNSHRRSNYKGGSRRSYSPIQTV